METTNVEELEAKVKLAAMTAIVVQDACNLSGVVKSFSDILMETLWPYARAIGKGTDFVNQHPISKLFADKIAHLTRTQYDSNAVFEAYPECYKLAGIER